MDSGDPDACVPGQLEETTKTCSNSERKFGTLTALHARRLRNLYNFGSIGAKLGQASHISLQISVRLDAAKELFS